MSSHWTWAEKKIREHDEQKPFAPENGQPLKFKAGDHVVFTNDAGIRYRLKVVGLYQPAEPCTSYASGGRYLLDWGCWWFPAKEASLEFDYLPRGI
jgi:hypothetical protein